MFYYGIIISKPKSGKQYLRAIISYIKRLSPNRSGDITPELFLKSAGLNLFYITSFSIPNKFTEQKKLSYQYQ